MKRAPITIAGTSVDPGKTVQIPVSISRLPTRTQIEVPIVVSHAKKDGPVLLLTGGMHGDEINGVEIVRRLIVNDYHRPEIGTTICIPIINVHGFLNFSRQVPDGKDINRSFPGTRHGSLASQIAYHLRTDILPKIDIGLDFHTGGSRINNFPQVRGLLDDEKTLELAIAFGSRFIINAPLRRNSLRQNACKLGKNLLIYEGGESLRLRKHAIDEGINGALRVMDHLGMRSSAPNPIYETTLIQKSSWTRASAAGLYYSLVRPGDEVKAKQVLAIIAGPFGDYEKKIRSRTDGYVIAVNNNPVVNRGDALMHIGQDGTQFKQSRNKTGKL